MYAAFNLDYFTEVQDMSHLMATMGDDMFSKRFRWDDFAVTVSCIYCRTCVVVYAGFEALFVGL